MRIRYLSSDVCSSDLMDNLTPFSPENEGPGLYGWSGIMRGASIIFFAYIGFDAVSTAAQEAKNPQKDMPKGILGSLAVCTVLYILVSLVMTGVVSFRELDRKSTRLNSSH